MIPRPHPNGLADLDPLPEIPQELATVSIDALLLAIGAGVPLTTDPYAAAKITNYDRLLFAKMPILCDGPRRILTLGPTRRAES
jgi:hypothetical protein